MAVLILFVVAAFSYIRNYAPAKEANVMAVQALANEREVLFALERQEVQQQSSAPASSRSLQEKLPVSPLEDLILLQLQRAEVESDVNIQGVNFSLDYLLIEYPPEQVENVETVTTVVQLDADSYSQIDRFIEEIESMDRIFVMERIEFTAPVESATIEQKNDSIQSSVTFNAYFRPNLGCLVDEAPIIDVPAPVGRRDSTTFNQMLGLGDNE